MPVVDAKDFHPHTGAYWAGWDDAIAGKPKMTILHTVPSNWDKQSVEDYQEGYRDGLADLERLPRQPHEKRSPDRPNA